MKTRREFMRFTLGGLACVAAAVMGPRTLMASSNKEEVILRKDYPWRYYNKEGDITTAGYVQIEGEGCVPKAWTITVNSTDENMFVDGDNITWTTTNA